MTQQHTPGPWIHLGQGDIVSKSAPTCSADGYTDVAAVYVTSDDLARANANLIAAAPELLASLQFAVALLKPMFGCTVQVQRLEAVLLKATGEQL